MTPGGVPPHAAEGPHGGGGAGALASEGYMLELILDWSRTRSTIPLYDRETRTLRVGVRRLF